ncbi:bifunctional peptidase and arginyl-hydroxylase JMJD5-like [Anneissia japonica]|uniref:bifunctional peptidase and arginyl-hydroxylase JMJD5-like n=1 Tax=Anneissia japonica TaxID=1529436 RepID=UPI001425A168|nr:bifunctional peptidase and arginyl-hydroxylase JMJD5-like [Anneissia japonica]
MLYFTDSIKFIVYLLQILCVAQNAPNTSAGNDEAVKRGAEVPTTTTSPPGHLKPLGSHRPPEPDGIDTVNAIPYPREFYEEYVNKGKPLLMRGAASFMPAFQLWNDEFLKEKYGHLTVEVEEGKKENRSLGLWEMTLREYIDQYNNKDIYLVESIKPAMREDFYLLKCILCGGFVDNLQDAVLWFSSGGTKSVLHYDEVDNINCIMDGKKEFFMVDRKNHAFIDIDAPEGSYSEVDVEKADLLKYPGLGEVPWFNVTMEAGDCFYIPYKWFHQVKSSGRNLAVNVWFNHVWRFNHTDCDIKQPRVHAPLSLFKFVDTKEEIRQHIMSLMDDLNVQYLSVTDYNDLALALDLDEQDIELVFSYIDANLDSNITVDEVLNVNIAKMIAFLPEIFQDYQTEDESSKISTRDEL